MDYENGDMLCQEAIAKEMNNSRVAFQVLDHDESPPIGYTEITCHLIFDVKIDLTDQKGKVCGRGPPH